MPELNWHVNSLSNTFITSVKKKLNINSKINGQNFPWNATVKTPIVLKGRSSSVKYSTPKRRRIMSDLENKSWQKKNLEKVIKRKRLFFMDV